VQPVPVPQATMRPVEVPANATENEKIAYAYVQGVLFAFEDGQEYAEMGLTRFAECFYGTAASSLCSLRYAVECLLKKETATANDGRLRNWDTIAALGWGSPAAYFFEGLVCEAQGKNAEAAECYRKAALNPSFPKEEANNLKRIKDLNSSALERLLVMLIEREEAIFAAYEPQFAAIPRHEQNYSPAFLREQALECLKKDGEDLSGALSFAHAALQVDPFNGDNYAGQVALSLLLGNEDAAVAYLNEGLFADPDNEALNLLYNSMKKVRGQ